MRVGNFIFSCLVGLVSLFVFGSQPAQAALDPSERAAIDALCTSITNLSTNGGAGWSDVCSGTPVGNGVGEVIPAGLSINPSTNKITIINLQSKGLQGTLPKEIGNLSAEMVNLLLYGNQLSGTIPEEIGDMSALVTLSLPYNQFTGTVPSSIGRLSNLTTLSLGNNRLSGSLPDALGDLSALLSLEVENNQFSGVLPSTLNNLTKLKTLSLFNNGFTGNLPTLANSPDVVFLDLNDNAFTGSIPSQWANFQDLRALNLYINKLTGEVPDFSQTQLCALSIHRNAFTFADILPNDLANRTRLSNCGNAEYAFQPQAKIDSIRGAMVGDALSVVNYRQHPDDQIQWYRGVDGSATEIAGATGTSYTPTVADVYSYRITNPTLSPQSSGNRLVLTSHDITVANAPTYPISGEVIGNAPDSEINGMRIDLISVSAGTSGAVTLSQKGSFQFQRRLKAGDDYKIDVTHRSTVVCTPKTTTGTMQQSGVNITITCDLNVNKYTVNAKVSGLPSGKGLTLSLNGGSDLTLTGTGSVLTSPFSPKLDDGSTYRVTVKQNPPNVQCVVQNPLGGTINGADVTESVVCQTNPQYSLFVDVQGLEPNTTFELTNGGDILAINGNGQTPFSQQYFDGSNYDVRVSKQPANQQCVVQNGTGQFNGAHVTKTVVCQKLRYALSVNVQGLEPNKTVELMNGGDTLVVNGDGSATFTQQYLNGSNYDVQVSKQPADQQCVVQNGTGQFNGANVSDVAIVCSVQTEKIFKDGFE